MLEAVGRLDNFFCLKQLSDMRTIYLCKLDVRGGGIAADVPPHLFPKH
jgi:hypothetical protein